MTLHRPSNPIAARCIFYVMLMGLVLALVGIGVGIHRLLTQPREVFGTTVLFNASKLIFFYGFLPAYVYAFARGGSWIPFGVAITVAVLMWLDLAVEPPEPLDIKAFTSTFILSILTLGYGFMITPTDSRKSAGEKNAAE